MKKVFNKNQMIVTFLAVLIAVAGYLNYTDKIAKSQKAKQANSNTYDMVYSDDNLLNESGDIESMDEDGAKGANAEIANNEESKESEADGKETESNESESTEPGAAILTNGNSMSSFMVQARLNREQIRSKNKETLMEVINNDSISDEEKKKATESMVKLTELNEMENNLETLLKAKGFEDIVVTLSEEQADVIIRGTEVEDTKRAQIEDVIKRKTGLSADSITITPTE